MGHFSRFWVIFLDFGSFFGSFFYTEIVTFSLIDTFALISSFQKIVSIRAYALYTIKVDSFLTKFFKSFSPKNLFLHKTGDVITFFALHVWIKMLRKTYRGIHICVQKNVKMEIRDEKNKWSLAPHSQFWPQCGWSKFFAWLSYIFYITWSKCHTKNRIQNFGHKYKFWSKIKTLAKNKTFGQKSKFWSKIEILVKTRNFSQKSKFWSNTDFLVRIQNFGQKIKIFGLKNLVKTGSI